tara:strand:- start:1881 stop:2198 length:318 start_codon:yes stop_codon:yes gene_type:complete
MIYSCYFLFLPLCFFLISCGDDDDDRYFGKYVDVELGMSQSEVRGVLGAPQIVEKDKWVYTRDERGGRIEDYGGKVWEIHVTFLDGVVSKTPELVVPAGYEDQTY